MSTGEFVCMYVLLCLDCVCMHVSIDVFIGSRTGLLFFNALVCIIPSVTFLKLTRQRHILLDGFQKDQNFFNKFLPTTAREFSIVDL